MEEYIMPRQNNKLTDDIIKSIQYDLQDNELTYRDIAKKYDISIKTISFIYSKKITVKAVI